LKKRAMALDVGFKRIGIALSDPLFLTASPFKVLVRGSNEETFSQLKKIIEENNVTDVVVGIPISIRGEKTKMAFKIERFVEKFRKFLKERGLIIKFYFEDESFSTCEAEELMKTLQKRREFVDDVAAALILTSWLKRRSG